VPTQPRRTRRLALPRRHYPLYGLVWRLRPRSWLRQAVLRRALQRGTEATNRRDFEVAFARYDPQAELITDSRLVELGFDPVYRGREERIRFRQRWFAEWGHFRSSRKN
jgi:hypothetical protein